MIGHASAATPQAVIGMPFQGKWAYNAIVNPPYTDSNSSHPSVHHTPGGGDWATDLYASEGTPVKLDVTYATGALSFTRGSSTSCGQSILVNVIVDGTTIGWLYFAHLNNVTTSNTIINGMTLGTMHDWGSSCNPGLHTHVEFHNSTHYSCYADNGTPGVTLSYGTNLGVLGSSNTGPQQACSSIPSDPPPPPPPPPPLRIGTLNSDGHYYVKEGSLGAGWVDETPGGGVLAGYVSGTRIGVLMSDGTLYVKDGALDAGWTTQAGGVSQAILSGNLIGVLEGNTFYVKQGDLSTGWTIETASAKSIALSDANATTNSQLRLGYVDASGTLYAKEGSINAGWTTQAGGVSQAVLSGSLIGVLEGNTYYVKQGSMSNGWTQETASAVSIALSDATSQTQLRIGYVNTSGILYGKEGSINAGWTTQGGGVTQAVLSGNLIGALEGNTFYVKQGSLTAGWTQESGTSTQGSLWSL